MGWTKKTSLARIREAMAATSSIEVADLVREVDLTALPLEKAYRVDGVHIYVAILNTRRLLDSDKTETERSHRRLLRFLDIYQRVAHASIFSKSDAVKVDFQNERLHFIVYKPYDDETKRLQHAIAIAAVLSRAIEVANALHDDLPDARVAVGIESGVTLAVSNGTRGDREALYVGHAANRAAKLLAQPGIRTGEAARAVLGYEGDASLALTNQQVDSCVAAAALPFDEKDLEGAWAKELDEHALEDFTFTRPAPPLTGLDFGQLAPANSKRLECCYLMADIDGFTKFVDDAVSQSREASAIQILHVIRKELRDTLNDYSGRKVRYVGDCIHGVLMEGTSQTTDLAESVTSATLTAAAMRDAFTLIKSELPGAQSLGLAIGIELGPTSLTRLGVKGSRDRCAVGQAVLAAEDLQRKSTGTETRLGPEALKHATKGVKDSLPNGKRADLRLDAAVAFMRDAGESLRRHGVPEPAPLIVPSRAHSQ